LILEKDIVLVMNIENYESQRNAIIRNKGIHSEESIMKSFKREVKARVEDNRQYEVMF
jgi:hypothetical protein